MKKLWSTLVLLVLFLGTSSCSQNGETQSANATYPAPTTPIQTQVAYPAPATPTMIVQPQPTHKAYPTRWRDFTPTPNSTPGVWSEFSSSIAYSNVFGGHVVETLYFSIRYPSDWYLYPGFTDSFPGDEWHVTHIQNFERIDDPDEIPPIPGTIMLRIGAVPCLSAIGKACPLDLPLLSPGLPGRQEITYQSYNDFTYWDTYLYLRDIQFGIYGYMAGTPEENADLIKTLDKILATVVLQ